MDLWHYSLLFSLFVIHIMLPFSRSDLNFIALGAGLLKRTQDHVNEAYLISTFGYLAMLAGGELWRVRLGIGLRELFSRLIELPAKASLLVLRSEVLLIVHGILALSIIFCVLIYYFKTSGFGFNLGGFLLVTPALRPIAQFATFYSVLVGSYCLARYSEYKEPPMIGIVILLTLGLLFFGSRTALVNIFMLPALVLFIKLGRRLNLAVLAIGVSVLLFVVFLLDALRRPSFSLSAVSSGLLLNIFYGNSFSDTRDFAVILSFWDGHYFLGKTYLAGLFAFVPRFLSTFRDTWSIGVVTATMAGFSPTEHAGLRVGLFGEAYFNFGLGAVLLLGLFIGASIRLVDLRVKQSVAAMPRSGLRAYSYFVILTVVSVAENTSIASTLYSILMIFAASWLTIRVFKFLKLPTY
jgi:oligosaccharide repeat unit polymerase